MGDRSLQDNGVESLATNVEEQAPNNDSSTARSARTTRHSRKRPHSHGAIEVSVQSQCDDSSIEPKRKLARQMDTTATNAGRTPQMDSPQPINGSTPDHMERSIAKSSSESDQNGADQEQYPKDDAAAATPPDERTTTMATSHRRRFDTESKEYQIILLREQIAAKESSLALLRNNRAETMRDLERCNAAQRRAVARITSLQQRRVLLRRRQKRHTKLVAGIRASLAQTLTRRRRLAECATVEEMENIGQAETNQAEKQQMALSAEAQNSDMEIDDDHEDSVVDELPSTIECPVRWPDPDAFWRHTGPYLLMALSSREILKSAMDVISDQVTDESRRTMFWNTCLDIGILLPEEMSRRRHERALANTGRNDGWIQPNVPLCPYEMAGSCADPECSYQHLEQRPLGSVIPRELLPLPVLKLAGRTEKPEDETREKVSRVTDIDDCGPSNSFEENSNFVALPTQEDEEVSDASEEADEASSPVFWWNDESNLEDNNNDIPSQLSHFGLDFGAKVGQIISLQRHDSDVALQGMILDCAAFSLHCGRLDLYDSLRSLADEALGATLVQVGNIAMDVNATRNIFERSFVTQLTLAAIGLVLETAHELNESLNETTIPVEFLTKLSVLSTDEDIAGLQATCDISLSTPVTARVKVPTTLEEIKHEILAEYGECKDAAASSTLGNNTKEQIEDVLYPALEVAKCIISQSTGRGSKLGAFKAICFIGHLVLKLVKRNATSQAEGSGSFDENASRDLSYALDKVLSVVGTLCASFPPGELLLAPLMGANMSLKVSLRLYDRAHSFLGGVLVEREPSALSYSELLWSQLIQLRATLPDRHVDPSRKTTATLRKTKHSNQALHSRLADFTFGRHVFPRHVLLHDDDLVNRNISLGREFAKLVHNAVTSMSSLNKASFTASLRGVILRKQADAVTIATIPWSLLLLGPSLFSLDLSCTELQALPTCFGEYLTSLKRLDLSSNALSLLPSSFSLLEDLEDLNVANNMLTELPGDMKLRSLKRLDASNNKISQLPDCIRLCKLLEVLDMDRNPLNGLFWQLISQLPRLRILKPQVENTKKLA